MASLIHNSRRSAPDLTSATHRSDSSRDSASVHDGGEQVHLQQLVPDGHNGHNNLGVGVAVQMFDDDVARSNTASSFTSTVMDEKRRKKLVDEIEEMDKLVKAWRETSGMHTILEDLEKKKDKPWDVNDLTLSLAVGIEEGSKETTSGILESAVIAALLLSFSLPLVVDPPDSVAELPNNDWRKVLHLFGWGGMSIVGVSNIVYARIYSSAVSRSVRSVDKLRVQLAGNAFTETLIMVYAMFFFLYMGVLADTIVHFGTILGVIFTGVACVAVCVATGLSYRFLLAGHIEYGWRQHRGRRDDPVDDFLVYETLKRKMDYADHLRRHKKEFFKFSDNERETKAQGISDDGKDLMFKRD